MSNAPFVVTVASEKGGVGKTTVATNLAVYLKALREDLPVTIASFDNHFSIDAMFAIGEHRGTSVRDLFVQSRAPQATLGEYGVQFFASERHLPEPGGGTDSLRAALAASQLGGILILDTRPILDYFTRSALAAADLVLAPVKDRASLVNVAALQRALHDENGDASCLWLLPSLIDRRSRLREGVSLEDFLVFAARERGYQLAPTVLAKSPKVEGLATGFSRRTYPVLTHARGTLVHAQLRVLASFVLERFAAADLPLSLRRQAQAACAARRPPRRLAPECPLCGEAPAASGGWFCEDPARRRRSFLHGSCLEGVLGELDPAELFPCGGALVVDKPEPGWREENALYLHGFSQEGAVSVRQELLGEAKQPFYDFLRAVCGRLPEELPATRILLTAGGEEPPFYPTPADYRRYAVLRRQILRQLRSSFKPGSPADEA
ncbi:Cellulose biosynthesis protein BcsQ [Geoalkalibacter ferrihydriticus]|uniref:Cellulose biosynthesis protein BcsQ n=1 Tax=Geoalkalibacter ferrihydriticus TaxID=392333 RepID=A0A1G9P3N4_9BACT|nr:ParA family protein [Geoalkalibacter ferrihydriticus]SDL92785.1 Cellulose biosynthesis protein BcsQ [Geoalkalibacter ferrihydriticus]